MKMKNRLHAYDIYRPCIDTDANILNTVKN